MFSDIYGRRREREESWYDTAQICLNGHVITESLKTSPARAQAFCSECGAATISACPSCNEPIRGYYHIPGTIGFGRMSGTPSFCHACGAMFPWLTAAMDAANQLADLELGNSAADTVKEALPDIVSETPRTKVAAIKMKKVLDTAGPVVGDMFRDILINVLSETAKKVLFSGT